MKIRVNSNLERDTVEVPESAILLGVKPEEEDGTVSPEIKKYELWV